MFIFFLKGGDNLNVLTESKEIFCIFHKNFKSEMECCTVMLDFYAPYMDLMISGLTQSSVCRSVRMFVCHTSG